MRELITILTWPTFWQIGTRLTTGAGALILTLILTRNLGVTSYGEFSKILALVTIFYIPADFGLNAVFVKFATQKKSLVSQFFTNLLATRLVLAAFFLAISILTGFLLYGQLTILVMAAATILTTALFTTALGYFQYKLKYHFAFLANLASASLTLFLIWQFLPNLPILAVFGAILSGQFLAVVINLGKIGAEIKFWRQKINLKLVKTYLLTGLAVGVTLIFNLIYFKADIVILSVLKPATSVGLYGLAVRIFEWVITPPVFLLNSAYPILTRFYYDDFGKLLKLTKNLALILLISGMLGLLLVFFSASQLAILAGGPSFIQSSAALKILAIGLPAFYLTNLTMWLLIIFDKKVTLVLIYGLGAILNIAANLIFIPRFDFFAAAVTTVVLEGLILFASLFLIWKAFKR